MSLRTRPWNRVSQQIYSLSTTRNDQINMNICTYVAPLTMEPKQFMLGVYHNTKTWDNFHQTGEGLLQILTTDQSSLIRPLGKKSGIYYEKQQFLRDKVKYVRNLAYLTDCLGFIHLKVKIWIPESDHDLAICQIISWKNLREGTPLTTHYLKALKILR